MLRESLDTKFSQLYSIFFKNLEFKLSKVNKDKVDNLVVTFFERGKNHLPF